MPSASQRPHAADAQHDLLADAHLLVAAVELGGDRAGPRACSRARWCPAGTGRSGRPCTRQICALTFRPGKSTSTVTGWPSVARHQLHRHVVEIVAREKLQLPAVGVEVLAEVALLVQQADAHQRHAQFRGGS